jgi:hypothetical protein
MRISIVLLFTMLSSAMLWSQNGINYQAVARDAQGNEMANQAVSVRFVFTATGVEVYSETHTTTTTELGLINLVIGEGNDATGSLTDIDWTQAIALTVELDPAGGTNFETLETRQIHSVPSAFYGRDEDSDPQNEMQNLTLDGDQLSITGDCRNAMGEV